MNRYFLFFLLIAILGCDESRLSGNEHPDKPNIVWLISEDNSPLIGVYGDTLASTPHIDRLASEGVLYENAFANAPVCAPARSTLITGMYATSLGTHHMRCKNPVPDFVRFFPAYLKEAGYYTTNRKKKDYNTFDQEGVWDNDWWDWSEAFNGRDPGQPFFMMYNTWMSHEDKIHSDEKARDYYKATMEALLGRSFTDKELDDSLAEFSYRKGDIPLPPYHPPTDAMYDDWARYYNRMAMMDQEVGVILDLLKRDGLLENTIVFYFSDHGGVLPRSKRFIFESGLKTPLIIRFPDKYRHLAVGETGTRIEDMVSFIDLGPTVLSLAGIKTPGHMHGKPFLGDYANHEARYSYAFRGRMDERYDMVRTVRDDQYRYRINFMPHRIYGQHINFLWKAPSMQSWEKAFENGETNRLQSRFFTPKLNQELYDTRIDPHCVDNLALDSSKRDLIEKYRQMVIGHMVETRDTGVLPEAEMMRLSGGTTPYQYMLENEKEYEAMLNSALVASEGRYENLDKIQKMLENKNPVIRYWGATGCVILKLGAMELKEQLTGLIRDPSPSVRIAAAEALYHLHEQETALKTMMKILEVHFNELLKKENQVEGYAPEVFVLTHALNVITTFDHYGISLQEYIEPIAKKEKSDYAKRAAEYLIEKFGSN